MRPSTSVLTGLALLAVLATGCGGGGGGGGGAGTAPPANGLSPYTSHYTSGGLKETGSIDAQKRAQGEWTLYFENGQKRWTCRYVDGAFVASQPWTEWNEDGSIRARHDDGAPLGTPPLAYLP